jgi:septal ring factor EnvC (AmiA/AmiB activator)
LSRPDRNLKLAREARRAAREEVRRDLGDTGGQIEAQMDLRKTLKAAAASLNGQIRFPVRGRRGC